MKFLILSGTPKKEGVCYSVQQAVERGAADAGAEVKVLRMNGFERCRVCGDGMGICITEHRCIIQNDGFAEAQQMVREADALCIITPVYWYNMSEGLKSFLDRLRRCEFGQEGALSNKQVLLIASAGDSGNGIVNCIQQMEHFCMHTGAIVYDLIGMNRWNVTYKRDTAYAAAKAIGSGSTANPVTEIWRKK
jgi:Multimeric flavodoxin WrbA